MSRTAALAGGTVFGGDLGNSMVSSVPATLATYPCHSLETPSGPCSPVSVPVPAPPPWEGWLHACIPSGSQDPYWAASGPLGPWDPPSHLHSAPRPHPSPGCILRVNPSQGSCRGLLFQLLPFKRGDHPSIPTPSLDALKDYTSASDTASMFISNPFFPAWKLLSSLLGRENPAQVGLLDLSRLPPGWQPWSPTLC